MRIKKKIIYQQFIKIVFLIAARGFSQDVGWPTQMGKYFSSNFGENRDDHFHMGLDIKTGGAIGVEILAVEDGYISRIKSDFNGYGKALYQRTISGHEVVYAHLESFTPVMEKVWRLQQAKRKSYIVDAQFSPREFQVQKGDLIGFSGNTGHSFAPHLHFEYRSSKSVPLNPLTMAFDLEDNSMPIAKNLALVPISQGALINASPLPQTFPLFRDNKGIFHFADTISVFGEFGFSIEAIDKRQGTNNKYQFYRAELLIDGDKVFELEYNKIPFNEGKFAKTIIQHDMKRKNLGEFQKLYKLPEHRSISVHSTEQSGIIRLSPGFHSVVINIFDASGNKSIVKGVVAGSFPMVLEAEEILRDSKVTVLALSPRRGGLPIRDAVIYSFTSYGFPDQKLDILHSEKVKNSLHVTVSSEEIKNRILQIIGINQLGGMVNPYHWSSYDPKISVVDIRPDVKVSNTERGLFLQVDIDQYVPARVKIKLANDNTFTSYNLNQIRPNTFLSEMLSHQIVNNIKYLDVELSHENLLRETRFSYMMEAVGPSQKNQIFSNDRLCSIETRPGTFFQTNTAWIEQVDVFVPVQDGFHLSPVYQLQPYDLALRGKFKVGIKYNRDLVEHSKLGIYFYDIKSKDWVYTPTENNKNKQILTAELDQMDAITIIQDLDSPKIINTFPGNSGRYHIKDVNKIKIQLDDPISGIESEEASFVLKLNDKKLFPAYHPLKKTISYKLDRQLSGGQHKIDFSVVDRVGNESKDVIYFVVY